MSALPFWWWVPPHGTLLHAVEEHGPHITAMEEAISPGPSSSGSPTMDLYECLDALNHPHAGCHEEDELFQITHQTLESQQPFPFPGLHQPLQEQAASLPTLSPFQSFFYGQPPG